MQNNRIAYCYGGSVKRKLGQTGKGFQRTTFRTHKVGNSGSHQWYNIIKTKGNRLELKPVSIGMKGLKEQTQILAIAMVKMFPKFKSNSLNQC